MSSGLQLSIYIDNPLLSYYNISKENIMKSPKAIAGVTSSLGNGSADVYVVKTDANGNLIWERTSDGWRYECGYSIAENADGTFVISGYSNTFGNGDYDVYLIKTAQ